MYRIWKISSTKIRWNLWANWIPHPSFLTKITLWRFTAVSLPGSGCRDKQDFRPVLVSQNILEECGSMEPGCTYRVLGQLRSFNNKSSTGSRLVISAYAQSICPAEEESQNRLFLAGAICKPPTLRRTPLGRSISDIMLAVNRRYGRADYLPCIAWGQVANRLSQQDVGSCISFFGRFQSRIYTKQTESGAAEHTAYEVSIMHLAPQSDESFSF